MASEHMQELDRSITRTVKGLEPAHVMAIARAPYVNAAIYGRVNKVGITVFVPVVVNASKGKATEFQLEDESIPQLLQRHDIGKIIYCGERSFNSVVNVYHTMALIADAFVGYWDGKDPELGKLVLWATQAGKQFYNLYP